MNWKSTLVALVVLLGVGGYFLFVAQPEHKLEAAAEAQKTVLTTFEDKQIQSLEIQRGGERLVAKRAGEKKWRITEPIEALGDRHALDGIARKLAKLTAKRFVREAADDLAPFGLQEPKVTVTATSDSGQVVTVMLGASNEFDDTVFARTADLTRVVGVDKEVLAAADKSLHDLREKKLLDFEQKDATKVTVELAGKDPFVLEKRGEDWHLAKPIEERADKSTASSVLSTLRNVRAESFEQERVAALADHGLDQPALHAVVEVQGQEGPVELWVAAPPEGTEDVAKVTLLASAGVGQPVAKVKGHVVKNVDKSLFDLRDKQLLRFERKAVRRIKVTRGESFYIVEGEGDPVEWQLAAPKQGAVKKHKVSSLLSSLSYLKAKEFADEAPGALAPFGLEKPERQVELFGEENKPLATLLVGQAEGEFYFAKGAAQQRVSKIDKKAADRWAWNVEDVQETGEKKP